jgi:hypothetical protein
MGKKAPSATALVQAGSAAEVSMAWVTWLDKVDPSERQVLVDVLKGQGAIDGPLGVVAICQAILVEMFRGSISPVVATAAIPFIELMAQQIGQMHAAQGTNGTGRDLVGALLEVKQSYKIKGNFRSVPKLPDVLDADQLDQPVGELLEIPRG